MSLSTRLRHFGLQSLRIDQVRHQVAKARFLYHAKLRGRLKTADFADGVSSNTIFHNLKSLSDLSVNRSHMLVRPLSVIESLGPESRILAIGPRTEGELLNLFAHGFSPERVRGLDLISYSPWIDLGNMHDIPYPADSWDAVLLGWVLSYSTDQPKAAREVLRVTRPGGIVAVGVEYNPKSDNDIEKEVGYRVGGSERLAHSDQILELFRPHVGHVYFRHDVAPSRRDVVGSVCVVFSVQK